MKKKKLFSRDNQAYLYLLPWIVGMLVLQIYPFITSFYYSLTEYNALTDPKFVGMANYIRLFTRDKEFFKSLTATVTYAVLTVPFKIIMSLFIAILLNKGRKGIGALRTIYYLPSLFGGSMAVSILWKIMFMDDGMINAFLHSFGHETISFLGNPATALPTLSALEVWQFGSSMVMFLAALKQVPQSLYEAARIDGAGRIKSFFSITIPQISPIIFFCIIMQTINALQNFTSAFVVTQGGPVKSTYMLGLKLYNDGFLFMKMGYASATSWIIFGLVTIFTLVLFGTSKFWVFYGDE
ncbi:carbohydrate ABC transporter permease [Butyrivibrio sp. INlla21]|uniref:carbohydrate ABC transporter permease n=1 Tax=Butyrivibrio sp. INlla21 TaxID=1520811 RepID=UPI0008EF552F|nr:sugar ABC transporter permease [Butyrivibrio sp. INlla21]SFU95566.1 oligogalacturonide transport system permease protein [Butyrivibrio sp. INlla21]